MTNRSTKLRWLGLLISLSICATLGAGAKSGAAPRNTSPQDQSEITKFDRWLDYRFDPSAPMGDARNPAVILPATMATLVGDIAAARRTGEVLLIPAADLQRLLNQPFTGALLSPITSQLSNIRSFDGFSAIDGTGTSKGLPSQLFDPDAVGRRVTGENPEAVGKLLRDGDIVFGSHVVNLMTWGRYNHVALVSDAARGLLVESTAHAPSDQPGVRTIEWKSFASKYVHIGVVRVKRASPAELARVISWAEARKGKPYRWPIVGGLDKMDQNKFYCSQLVWLAFQQVLNLDLDVDQGALIFPDDIYLSRDYVDVIVP